MHTVKYTIAFSQQHVSTSPLLQNEIPPHKLERFFLPLHDIILIEKLADGILQLLFTFNSSYPSCELHILRHNRNPFRVDRT